MEQFVLVGITHPGAIELAEGLLSIGRNPTNDFRVPDATVSSFHCELIVSGESVRVRDLNSTNGTFVNDELVHEAALNPWQILRLGTAELRLELHQKPDHVTIAIPQIEPPQPLQQTTLLDGSLACLNHPGVAAVARCLKCETAFCGGCVRALRLEGGQTRLFCPTCSGPCDPIETRAAVPKKRASFLSRLTQTIRIRWK
jgi:hypothetical protein